MTHLVIEKLQQFTELCHRLQMQLKEDQGAFATHAYQAIHDNNQKKADMLSTIVNEINTISTAFHLDRDIPFLKALENHGAHLEKNLQSAYQKTVLTLKAQLLNAYEILLINTQVVNSQLNQVKMVIDQVHRFETQQAYVYSGKKVTEK